MVIQIVEERKFGSGKIRSKWFLSYAVKDIFAFSETSSVSVFQEKTTFLLFRSKEARRYSQWIFDIYRRMKWAIMMKFYEPKKRSSKLLFIVIFSFVDIFPNSTQTLWQFFFPRLLFFSFWLISIHFWQLLWTLPLSAMWKKTHQTLIDSLSFSLSIANITLSYFLNFCRKNNKKFCGYIFIWRIDCRRKQ